MINSQIFFELSQELLCAANLDGYLVEVNPMWTQVLGWTLTELMARPFVELVHPDDRQATVEQMQLLKIGGVVVNFENRFRHKEGHYIWLSWKAIFHAEEGLIIGGARDVTEIRRHKVMWDQAQEVLEIGAWEIDLTTKKLFWSKITHLIHETDPLTYKPMLEDGLSFYHPESIPALTPAVERLMREGTPYRLTLKFITAKGRLRWVETNARAEFSHGAVVRVYGTFQDVTERVQEELNLKRFKNVVELAREGIWEIDAEGRTIYANSRMAELLETKADEMIGSSFLSFMDPDHVQEAVAKLQSRRQGQDDIHEFRFKTKTDKPLWALVSTKAVLDEQGKMLSAVAMVSDISFLKEQSEHLIKERNRFESLVSALDRSAIVATTDKAGRITFVNDLFCEISGYQRNELMGQNHRVLNSGYHPREYFVDMWKTIRSGQVWHGEICNRKKNGDIYWVDSTLLPLQETGQHFDGYIAIRFDITNRKNLENDLREAKVREERANSAKSQFLATMSHEIRSPLNGVLGMSDMLAESHLTETQKECVSAIKYSAESLLSIINDILDFSKIEAGRLELETINFDVYKMLEELAQTFRVSNRGKPVELLLEAPQSGQKVFCGDPTRLRQILSNLIGNAMKFTQQGKIWIRAKEYQQDHASCRLRFEVEDQGVGIPLEVQKRLFQPFSQADSSTTRKFGGTGLGLSICKKLVELMSGDIGVESVEGKGAAFWFEVIMQAEAVNPSANEKASFGAERSRFQGKVLVVDDNEINRKVALSVLKGFGLEVVVVGGGEEAILEVQQCPYQIIFMDCQMPKMDGYEATQHIRALNLPHQPTIIAMTANALAGDREKCLAAGMDDYLTKPLRSNLIENVLQNRLKPSEGGDVRARPIEPSFQILWERVLNDFDQNKQLLREILSEYLRVHGSDWEKIEQQLLGLHARQAEVVVHTLKGVVAIFQVSDLQNALQEVESHCRRGDVDQSLRLLRKLQPMLTDFNSQIEAFYRRLIEEAA